VTTRCSVDLAGGGLSDKSQSEHTAERPGGDLSKVERIRIRGSHIRTIDTVRVLANAQKFSQVTAKRAPVRTPQRALRRRWDLSVLFPTSPKPEAARRPGRRASPTPIPLLSEYCMRNAELPLGQRGRGNPYVTLGFPLSESY
jgi:hypothetical protein